MSDARELMSKAAHDIWAHWMKYMFSQCDPGKEGAMIIPSHLVDRWSTQMNTEYEDLTEEEKDSDRGIAGAFLSVPVAHLVLKARKAGEQSVSTGGGE